MIRHAPSIGLGLGLSLRSTGPGFVGLLDQYGGAAAAYSLRALSSGWLAGDVVEVRPSSGWTPASFTANQVANGELVDYVKRCGDFTNNGFETFTNNGTGDGFTAINSASTGFSSSYSISGVSSDVVTIDFDIDITTGSPALALRVGTGSAGSNVEIITTSGSKSLVLTATANYDNFTFSDGDVPAEFTISNVRVSTNDGFVSTWYDQSGNANDATQATTTAQPKIVDAGALVAGGLDFDGVDDMLDISSISQLSNQLETSVISVHSSRDVTSVNRVYGADFSGFTNSATIHESYYSASETKWLNRDSLGVAINLAISAVNSTQYLTFNTIDSSAESHSWMNGGSAQSSSGANLATPTTHNSSKIGARSSGIQPLNGLIAEIILYPNDQAANRVAIEANINAAYSIY